jgi:hypothetical protein
MQRKEWHALTVQHEYGLNTFGLASRRRPQIRRNFNKKPYTSIDAEAGTPRFEKKIRRNPVHRLRTLENTTNQLQHPDHIRAPDRVPWSRPWLLQVEIIATLEKVTHS